MRIALLVVALLAAGCLETPPTEPRDQPTIPTKATEPARLFLEECRQYHTFFAARAEDFRTAVPKGFKVAANGQGTFNLGIEVTSCQKGPDPASTRQAFITVPVVPPKEREVEGHAWLVPIEAYAEPALLAAYRDLGAPKIEKCACKIQTLQSTPIVDEIVLGATNGTYTLRAVMNPSSGPFSPEKVALYLAVGGEAHGVLLGNYTGAANRGFGPIAFQYQGTGGAPPLHSGIAHSVSGLKALYEYRAFSAAA